MKKSLQTLLIASAVALSGLTAQAQSTLKILTVDLNKVVETHYKTQEQLAKINADTQKAQDQLAQIAKDGNALVDQYKELDEQSKNPATTAEAKAKVQADLQKKAQEIQQKQQEQQAFIQNTRNSLQQRRQNFQQLIIEEVSKIAVEIAKTHGATFLIDKSGPTLAGVSSILYADPSLDITDEVVAQIAKDRPATAPAATSAAPAATSAAPAAGDAPKITVPGLK